MQTEIKPEYLTLAQAARLIPGKPSPNCVWRWCRNGVKSRAGARVRLQHTRYGGRVFTTREWIEAFGQAVAEADAEYFTRPEPECRPTVTRSRSAARREKEITAAEKRLAAAGV